MPSRNLIVVTGLIGSGKSTVCAELHNRYGTEVLSISDELAVLARNSQGLDKDTPVSGLDRLAIHRQVRSYNPQYFSNFILENLCQDRVIDGLRNLADAEKVVRAGGIIVSLVAPRALRMQRRKDSDLVKDPDFTALMTRELQDLDDPNPDSAQALRVMWLANEHGFFVNGDQSPEVVMEDVISGLANQGVKLQ